MKMNKERFIKKLSEELNYQEDKCVLINDILENNFVISKKSKESIINELIQKLDVDDNEANLIYETATKLIKDQVLGKLKHPFRNKD